MQPTSRQLRILAMCAGGMSREEIGRELFISPWTVKRELDDLRIVLEARNVTNAVAVCMVRGYLRVELDEVVVSCRQPAPVLVAA